MPIVQAVVGSETARFRQVTPEGLVTVMLAIAQGSSIQSLFSNQRVEAEQILGVIRALLLSSGA